MTYIQPLILLFSAVVLVGLARLRRCKGALLPTLGAVALLLLAWPPAAWVLSRPLEARYPLRPPQPEGAQAIVVLSSSVDPPRIERPYPLPSEDTYHRCEFAAWLFQQTKTLPVLASGGNGSRNQPAYSETMRQLLQRAGVPESMIWTEEQSRSTHENAVESAKILRQHGIGKIALIIDAQSMPRAEASFRKQGIEVIPAPNSFVEFAHRPNDLVPGWKAIRENETTLHEVFGLLWYWLRGWI